MNTAVRRGQTFLLNCRFEGEAWRYRYRRWTGGITLIKGDGSVHYNPEKFSIVSQHPNDWNLMVKDAQLGRRYILETNVTRYPIYTFVIVYGKHSF